MTVQWDVPLLDGYSWSHVPNRGTGKESFWGLRNPGLWSLIRKGKFDAVLLHIGYVRSTFWIAYLAARLSGSAFLFGTDASSLAPRDGASWKPWLKRAVWPLLFRLADQVMVPSSATAEMMRELGVPEDRISLTHFVVDNDWWTEQAGRINRRATRAELGAADRDIAVLFCAKLQDWKRPLDLLRAFAKAAVPDSILLFAGEGPLRAQIESEAAALGIASRVRMLGFTRGTPAAIFAIALRANAVAHHPIVAAFGTSVEVAVTPTESAVPVGHGRLLFRAVLRQLGKGETYGRAVVFAPARTGLTCGGLMPISLTTGVYRNRVS